MSVHTFVLGGTVWTLQGFLDRSDSDEDSLQLGVRAKFSQNPDLLERLVGTGTVALRCGDKDPGTAQSPALEMELELLRDQVRMGFLPRVTIDELWGLASGGEAERVLAADHLGAPPELLATLSVDPRPSVRRTIARRTPPSQPSLFAQLVIDSDDVVRRTVAENPGATADALGTLAADDFHGSRYGVARNPSTSVDVLRSLTTDPVAIVANAASRSLKQGLHAGRTDRSVVVTSTTLVFSVSLRFADDLPEFVRFEHLAAAIYGQEAYCWEADDCLPVPAELLERMRRLHELSRHNFTRSADHLDPAISSGEFRLLAMDVDASIQSLGVHRTPHWVIDTYE